MLPLVIGVMRPRLIVVMLIAIVAIVIAAALLQDWRARGAILTAEPMPAEIGQRFQGHVAIRTAPAGDLLLVLRCLERDMGSDYRRWSVLWQDERVVTPDAPFAFDMPAQGKPSGRDVRWELDASGVRFHAVFRLPVVATSKRAKVPEEALRPFATVKPSLRR